MRSSLYANINYILFSALLVFFPISMILEINFYDEFFVLLCIFFFIKFKKKDLDSSDRKVILCLLVSYAIGIVSNFKSKIIPINITAAIDLFSVYKFALVFIALRNLVTITSRKKIVFIISKISKIFVIFSFVFCILSQFIDLGMTYGERYGIKAFHFIFGNHSHFGIILIACLLIIGFSESKRKNVFTIYLIISIIPLLLTTKGVIYSFLIFSAIFLILNRKKVLKIKNFILPIIILLFVSSLQINDYFKNEDSIRMTFFFFAIKTANNYFPLGSGFATYGSAEAAKNYSPLYYEYGFNNLYGLGDTDDNNMYLNDNYWATIIGELGYIGFGFMVLMFLYIFKIFNNYEYIDARSKLLLISALIMLFISSIATGIIKSMPGVFLFSIFAILLPNKHEKAQLNNINNN